MTQRIGNWVTLVAPSVGCLGKCIDISEVVEVDVVDGLMDFEVDPYLLHRFWRLTSDDNVMR